jgi:hypothetical protein
MVAQHRGVLLDGQLRAVLVDLQVGQPDHLGRPLVHGGDDPELAVATVRGSLSGPDSQRSPLRLGEAQFAVRRLGDRVACRRVGLQQIIGGAAGPVRQAVARRGGHAPALPVDARHVDRQDHGALRHSEAVGGGPGLAGGSLGQTLDQQAAPIRGRFGELGKERAANALTATTGMHRDIDGGEVGRLIAEQHQACDARQLAGPGAAGQPVEVAPARHRRPGEAGNVGRADRRWVGRAIDGRGGLVEPEAGIQVGRRRAQCVERGEMHGGLLRGMTDRPARLA